MRAVLEENYFPWNSFSFLEAAEMKVSQRTVDQYGVPVMHCYTGQLCRVHKPSLF